jgi:hypothetical protein
MIPGTHYRGPDQLEWTRPVPASRRDETDHHAVAGARRGERTDRRVQPPAERRTPPGWGGPVEQPGSQRRQTAAR